VTKSEKMRLLKEQEINEIKVDKCVFVVTLNTAYTFIKLRTILTKALLFSRNI